MTIREIINAELQAGGGADSKVRNVVLSALPWEGLDELRIILEDGVVMAAVFQNGIRISDFKEIKEQTK